MKLALLLSFAAALASPVFADHVTATVNGVELRFVTRVGGKRSPAYGDAVRVHEKKRLYREISDRGRLAFGYEVEVTEPDAAGRVRLTLKPLGYDYIRDLGSDAAALGVDPQHLPTFTQARDIGPLRPGQGMMFELLRNPSTGESVADSIQIVGPAAKQAGEFGFENLKIAVDGQAQPGGGSIRGTGVVMFYLPGHGPFFFATKPQDGFAFAPIGTVEGKRLTFDLNGHHYECVSDTGILATSGKGQLWILHDVNLPPASWLSRHGELFFTAAAPTMASLLR